MSMNWENANGTRAKGSRGSAMEKVGKRLSSRARRLSYVEGCNAVEEVAGVGDTEVGGEGVAELGNGSFGGSDPQELASSSSGTVNGARGATGGICFSGSVIAPVGLAFFTGLSLSGLVNLPLLPRQ